MIRLAFSALALFMMSDTAIAAAAGQSIDIAAPPIALLFAMAALGLFLGRR